MRRFLFWSMLLCLLAAAALGVLLSPWWALLLLLPATLWLIGCLHPHCGWWGPVMTEFPTRKREALLTFNDGPDPLETPRALDLMDEHGAKGIFFLTGVRAMRHPDLVREIVTRGHAIGIHGMSYAPGHCWTWMPWKLRSEIETATSMIRQIVGSNDLLIRWYRSPQGRCSPWLAPLLDQHGMQLMSWSAHDGAPRLRDFEKAVILLRRDIHQGAVIALHHHHLDSHGEPLLPDLTQEMLMWLKGQGYSLG